jgi:FkbM family methyltransferase
MKICLRKISFDVADDQYVEAWKFINSGKWEPRTFDILDNFIRSDGIVLDLGAWVGAVSLYAAHLAAKIYALEPDPVVFPYLVKNVLQNPDQGSKIKCCRMAISSNSGKFTLYARDQYGVSSSSLLPRIRDGLSSVQVEGLTLRKFIESEKIKEISFIKMDIEGGEFDLIPSMAEELQNMNFPTLFVSFHYNYLREHQYLITIKMKLISRLFMKLENWTGIDMFRKSNRKIVMKCLQSLKDYKFIYTESGQSVNQSWLLSHPQFIKDNNLVFTNKQWLRN